MTARKPQVRRRNRPALILMPPLHCTRPGCDTTFEPVGDYRDTYAAAAAAGWDYRRGHGSLCPRHQPYTHHWPPVSRSGDGPGQPGAPAAVAVITDVPWPGIGTQGDPATGAFPPGVNTGPGDNPVTGPPLEPLPDATVPFVPPQFTEFAAEMARLDGEEAADDGD